MAAGDLAAIRELFRQAVADDDKSGDIDNCTAVLARKIVPILLTACETDLNGSDRIGALMIAAIDAIDAAENQCKWCHHTMNGGTHSAS